MCDTEPVSQASGPCAHAEMATIPEDPSQEDRVYVVTPGHRVPEGCLKLFQVLQGVFQSVTGIWVGGWNKVWVVPILPSEGPGREEENCSALLMAFELGNWSSFAFGLRLGSKLHRCLSWCSSFPVTDLRTPWPPLMCELTLKTKHLRACLCSRHIHVCVYHLSKDRSVCMCGRVYI